MPSDAYDAKGLLSSSIADNNPVMFFEHKLLYNSRQHVPEDNYQIPIGKAEIKRKGSDITLIATSYMVRKALNVAEKLAEQGTSIEVVDPRTIKPLDMDLITRSVKKTNRVVLVEESYYSGGFTCYLASEIMKYCFDWLDAPVLRVTGLDCPIPYENNLEKLVIPDEERIEDMILKLLK
jgi:pyruvate dehydrogenase E1 component beta subunit